MPNQLDIISLQDRVALLREGVVVVTARSYEGQLHVNVTGEDEPRVRAMVRARLGADVDVGVCGSEPREIRSIACGGQNERDPRRLQLFYLVRSDAHLDDIDVFEDDESVTVFATVCVPLLEDGGWERDSGHHVYLDRPLGGRTVIDGVTGRSVPHGNHCYQP